MALYDLLIKDSSKKEFVSLPHINKDRNNLIISNIRKIANDNLSIRLEYLWDNEKDHWNDPKWTSNSGLYETLVREYNRLYPEARLTAWCE